MLPGLAGSGGEVLPGGESVTSMRSSVDGSRPPPDGVSRGVARWGRRRVISRDVRLNRTAAAMAAQAPLVSSALGTGSVSAVGEAVSMVVGDRDPAVAASEVGSMSPGPVVVLVVVGAAEVGAVAPTADLVGATVVVGVLGVVVGSVTDVGAGACVSVTVGEVVVDTSSASAAPDPVPPALAEGSCAPEVVDVGPRSAMF